MYLLDANVLMTANNTYYPIEVVPEFWSWLLHQCDAGHVKMPIETFEEVKDGSTDADRDLLYGWIHDASHKQAIVLVRWVDTSGMLRVLGFRTDWQRAP